MRAIGGKGTDARPPEGDLVTKGRVLRLVATLTSATWRCVALTPGLRGTSNGSCRWKRSASLSSYSYLPGGERVQCIMVHALHALS